MDEITPRALTASEIEYMGELLEDLTNLRDSLCSMAAHPPFSLNELDSGYRISAENLLHYLALRRQDIRLLQQRLVLHRVALAPSSGELPRHTVPPPCSAARTARSAAAKGWFAAEPEGEPMAPEHESASFAPEAEEPPQPGSWFSGAAPEPEPEFEPEPEA